MVFTDEIDVSKANARKLLGKYSVHEYLKDRQADLYRKDCEENRLSVDQAAKLMEASK